MTVLNADDLPLDGPLRTTVGVVGGGAAGIALALRLAERGVDCVVCESGGRGYSQRHQELYAGESNGYFDLTATRLRQLGGTTNHFAGQSRPLSPLDFNDAPWRPGTSWPIGYDEFARHLPAAAAMLGVSSGDGGVGEEWEASVLLADLPALEVADLPGGFEFGHQLFTQRAVSIAETQAEALATSGRATVILGLNATAVELVDGGTAVDHIVLATLDGRRVDLEAEVYVLATGGIESARLLLASTGRTPAGVGNSSGLVGRYFADHPETPSLPLITSPDFVLPTAYRNGVGPFGDTSALSHPGLTEDAQAQLGLPGFHVRVGVVPVDFPDDEAASAVSALTGFAAADPELAGVVNVAFDVVPNPGSTVTLGSGRNELGERTADVSWNLTDDDEAMMTTIVDVVARWLAQLGVGRLDTRPPAGTWADSVVGQHHHMGTLRLSSSPSQGVVDTNLRLHDVPNLYAAGSAVFPTFGHVNPTMNLMALSLRLADHLADEVVR